jgi:hypothetical protein
MFALGQKMAKGIDDRLTPVIARSETTKQSRLLGNGSGLLRFARNDDD